MPNHVDCGGRMKLVNVGASNNICGGVCLVLPLGFLLLEAFSIRSGVGISGRYDSRLYDDAMCTAV